MNNEFMVASGSSDDGVGGKYMLSGDCHVDGRFGTPLASSHIRTFCMYVRLTIGTPIPCLRYPMDTILGHRSWDCSLQSPL